MATAFISSAKQVYPGARIDVIIKKDLLGIAELIEGLNVVYPFSKNEYRGVRGTYRFGRLLMHEKYDLFFNLPASLSSVIMAWATGAKKTVGFKKEGGSFLLTSAFDKTLGLHRADQFVDLLEKYTGNTVHNREVSLSVIRPESVHKNRVLINFNSEASSRRMPPEKGVAIINALIGAFPDHLFTLLGSPKESGFVEGIIERAGKKDQIENMAGKTSLAGLCNLMAGSAALISTDSGPAHLANAVGTPVIVLFGAGDENNTSPYNRHNLTVIRYGKLACEPCLKNECKLYGIPKCLQLIDDLQIINSLKSFLSDKRA